MQELTIIQKQVIPFEFLEQTVNYINVKFKTIDSENQLILVCDYLNITDETTIIIYQDVAYVLGNQPFEITNEELESL